MTGNRTQAERALAIVIHEIRDEWDTAGITAALRHCTDRPMSEVTAAALYAAIHRLDLRTPAPIAKDGEHWRALTNLAGQPTKTTNTPPTTAHPTCTICGRPKTACRKADALAPTHDYTPKEQQ